VILLIKKYT